MREVFSVSRAQSDARDGCVSFAADLANVEQNKTPPGEHHGGV